MLQEYGLLRFPPSKTAAAALNIALRTIRGPFAWNETTASTPPPGSFEVRWCEPLTKAEFDTAILCGADGKPHRRLSRLQSDLGDAADKVRFAMNAGMFDVRGAPIGLYVENGDQRHAISTTDGPGNFHLKPNGVFWVDAAGDRLG